MATDPYLSERDRPLRVLIVRTGAMGDVLHAMPAVAALRAARPECFIGWTIEPRWSVLLQSAESYAKDPRPEGQGGVRTGGMPMVDLWHPFPVQRWKRRPVAPDTLWDIRGFLRELRSERYDVCVDMQGLIRSAVIGRLAGAERFVGAEDPRERLAQWLYGQRVKRNAVHVIEQGCELLGAAVGEALRPVKVSLPMDEEAESWCDGVVDSRFVVMAPTAGWGAKEWPAERYGAVAAELGRAGFRTLVNASSDDNVVARAVVEASEGSATVVPCSIGQLIALVRRASLVVAGDTGPLHLAAALERPVVGLYGPTDPARTGPFGTRSRVLRDAGSVTNHKRLSSAEDGLLKIGVGEVVEAALELLTSIDI